MTRFRFRLQKVLEYRERIEHEAKDAYLDARAKRLEAEAGVAAICTRRVQALRAPVSSLDDRQTLELFLLRLEEEQRQQTLVVEALETDEECQRLHWIEKRQDHEAMLKLHDAALEAWELDARRQEQAELDEWAVLNYAT